MTCQLSIKKYAAKIRALYAKTQHNIKKFFL